MPWSDQQRAANSAASPWCGERAVANVDKGHRGLSHEQVVTFQKIDHVAVKQPRLLNLTGMASAMKNLHLAIGDKFFERECGLVRTIFAPTQYCSWTLDA